MGEEITDADDALSQCAAGTCINTTGAGSGERGNIHLPRHVTLHEIRLWCPTKFETTCILSDR